MQPDTYGITNEVLALWGDKTKVKIQTKVLGSLETRASVIADTEHQLKAIGVEQFDICLLHWPGTREGLDQAELRAEHIRGFETLMRDGAIRDWGLSNCPFEDWEDYVALAEHLGVKPPRWAQNRLNPICDDTGLNQAPVPCQAYGIFHYGWLAGRYESGFADEDSRISWVENDWRWGGKKLALDTLDLDYPIARKWVADARASGFVPAVRALSWVLEKPYVLQAVIGVSKPEQLDDFVPQILAG